jgi:hypothetical protein
MSQDFQQALQVALLGLLLVPVMMAVFWGGMALLTRLTSRSAPESPGGRDAEVEAFLEQVAVAGAAAAVELDATPRPTFPLPPTALVSAWQAVMRAEQLRRKEPRR